MYVCMEDWLTVSADGYASFSGDEGDIVEQRGQLRFGGVVWNAARLSSYNQSINMSIRRYI